MEKMTVRSLITGRHALPFWVLFWMCFCIGLIFDKRILGAVGILLMFIPIGVALSLKMAFQEREIMIRNPGKEAAIFLLWYGFYILFLTWGVTKDLPTDMVNWIPFVIIPGAALWAKGYTRGSLGLTRVNLTEGLKLSGMVSIVCIPGIVLALHLGGQLGNPGRMFLLFPLGFGVALLGPAVTEEVFFRAILIERVAFSLKSEPGGVALVALLNGLYHLPYAYLLPQWPTHGNALWAVSAVVTEQALTSILLGILWVRTRNLACPVFLHAFIDAFFISGMAGV